MDAYDTISSQFQDTIGIISMSVDALAPQLTAASALMAQALLNDRKIMACGNGPDTAVAHLFAGHLLSSYETERPALPAIALGSDSTGASAITTINGVNDVFSRPLRALGDSGDVLLCITSTDGPANLLRAVQAAHERNMTIVLLSNAGERELENLLDNEDIVIQIPSDHTGRVLEMHTMIIHCLCTLIEHTLFGHYTQD
ncbi:MAG: SIS domain-containing protein [Halioglobus sp.]